MGTYNIVTYNFDPRLNCRVGYALLDPNLWHCMWCYALLYTMGIEYGSTEAMCVKLKLVISLLAKSAIRKPRPPLGWEGRTPSKVC